MAKQTGIIKLKGKIGDLSFYKTQDGHLAREKGGVDAERIAKDPAFIRTRENGAEFGSLVNLGWQPQWVLVKQIDNGTITAWVIVDTMRGFVVESGTEDSGDALLFPFTNGAEIDRGRIRPEALGFTPRNYWNAASTKFIYMAIRMPNKPPTSGTQVYNGSTTTLINVGFTSDMQLGREYKNINAAYSITTAGTVF